MDGVWKQGTKANEQGVLWVQSNPRVVHVRCEVRLAVALCCLRMGCCLLRNRVAIRWALLHTCARDTCPPGREASYWVRVRSTNAPAGVGLLRHTARRGRQYACSVALCCKRSGVCHVANSVSLVKATEFGQRSKVRCERRLSPPSALSASAGRFKELKKIKFHVRGGGECGMTQVEKRWPERTYFLLSREEQEASGVSL